jgi:hypothetical protein
MDRLKFTAATVGMYTAWGFLLVGGVLVAAAVALPVAVVALPVIGGIRARSRFGRWRTRRRQRRRIARNMLTAHDHQPI